MRVDGRRMLAFCSNDYLGLSQHPALREAAIADAQAYGVGSGASPMVSGHSEANAALERELAEFARLRRALAAAARTGGHASRRGLYMATLGKAAGVAGAFVAGSNVLVEWLLQKTRSYTFATAAPAMLAEGVRAALRVFRDEPARLAQLHR